MCDYSLEDVASRAARVGDKLVSSVFLNTISRGFAAVGESGVAVCLLPGTELKFEEPVGYDHVLGFFPTKILPYTTAIFRKVNLGSLHEHHDALEFPDGKRMLLTRLVTGQQAIVLQLPRETPIEEGQPESTPAEGQPTETPVPAEQPPVIEPTAA